MVMSTYPDDLGSRLIEAGGADAFLLREIRTSADVRAIASLSTECHAEQAAAAHAAQTSKAEASLQTAAEASISDARDRLEEIREQATNILTEHDQRKRKVEELLDTIQQLKKTKREYAAVSKCRELADAYLIALHPLAMHQRDGNMRHMDTVASNIEKLIEKADFVRKKSNRKVFGDDPSIVQRVVTSIENRAVDAVIKARAAFVNVLDNEFRRFGWPMKVPSPDADAKVIESVNFYVKQLSQLQKVASEGDYVPERTKWHRALSDSWGIAAILRAPLARFKYHFLEGYRSDAPSSETNGLVKTSRFDRPEWAAEFALERIQEATPFLAEVAIDGPHSAEVKFAEGFCRVFADKVAYDCELAMRTSTHDSDTDALIAHASDTAKQFDAKLRKGIMRLEDGGSGTSVPPLFMSSLHILSKNEGFFTAWASSELGLAERQVSQLLQQALGPSIGESNVEVANVGSDVSPVVTREQLEFICQEIIGHIGQASEKCRALDSQERIQNFLKLTELPLLHLVRGKLKNEVELVDYEDLRAVQVERSGRASFCAQLIADFLEDRSLDPFYVMQEKWLGHEFYADEINRLRSLYTANCSLLSDAVSGGFVDALRSSYADQTRFGEITAPNAAIVVTHDVSDSLVAPLTALENYLSAIKRGIPCRKSASTIWRPIARSLDAFFFDDIVLQCFVGGTRNAMAAASKRNDFLSPTNSARMARQVSYDAASFVSTFSVVSNNPSQFLPYTAECGAVLQMAATKVLMADSTVVEEDEQVLDALRAVAKSADEDCLSTAKSMLEANLKIFHISPREALELLAIGGLRFAIPLS